MIRFILCDIEGTTTSISFVHNTLFPYARKRLATFVREHMEDPKIAAALNSVKATLKEEDQIEATNEQAIAELLQWIDHDRKHAALKDLQGYLWRHGYENGEFQGHVYPDVPHSLERWREAGYRMGIYSSGSVEAQQLLFGYSEAGDLNPFFEAYFDTRIGHKRDDSSYEAIARELELPPEAILFLSDVEEELDAARQAEMRTVQLLRPGTDPCDSHPTASDFFEIDTLILYS